MSGAASPHKFYQCPLDIKMNRKKFLVIILIFISFFVFYLTKRKFSIDHIHSVAISRIEGMTQLPGDPPTPQPGKAAISGVLYTFTGKGPIPGTAFYLVPAVQSNSIRPPFVLTGPRVGDPQGRSDVYGRIILNNINPGSYYLAVWAPYNWIFAVNSDIDLSLRLIVLEPNQRLNLGIIYVPWPY